MVEKDDNSFSKHSITKDGLQTYCKVCDNERIKISYQQNKTPKPPRVMVNVCM